MTEPRDRKSRSVPGLAGGFLMFAIEGLIVLSLTAVAWVVSTVLLAIL